MARCRWLPVALSALLGLVRSEMTEPASLNWEAFPDEALHLRAGQELSLECSATGSPPPVIRWLRKGEDVGESPLRADEAAVGTEVEQVANQGLPTIQMATTVSKLTRPCADQEIAGEYTCVASNGVGPALEKKVTVTVGAGKALCPKARRSPAAEAGAAARIGMWTDMRLERADAVAQLFCRATGSPRPTLTWYLLDDDLNKKEVLRPSEQFVLLRNGDLLVRDPQPSDQGGFQFLCEAKNAHGVDSRVISLVDVDMEGGEEDYDEAEEEQLY